MIPRLLLAAALLGGLALLGRWNYVVFHSLVELFSVGVGVAIFLIAWNVRRRMDNDFLTFIALASAAVGLLDLIHMLAYPGMGAIPGVSIDPPTQLWIAARYLQSLSLLIAPLWLTRPLPLKTALVSLGVIDALVLLSIFRPWPWWPAFPACHLVAAGLTPFKVASEYIISTTLLVAVGLLWLRRTRLDQAIFRYMVIALFVTMASEIAFTSYVSVKAPSNMIGHLLKAVAVYLAYKALIEAGLRRPFDVLFHNLSDSERRFRTLTLATFEGIAITEQGRLVDCNNQLARMLGYTPEEVIGQEVSSFIHPEDREAVLSSIRRGVESHLEHRMVRKDGSIIVVEAHGQLTADHPRPTRFTAVRDITQRKQVEEALAAAKISAEQAKATAEEANQAKDHFLAVLSHELRTPLNPALMAATILEASAQLPLALREDVSIIRRNVELEARLIDDMLDLTRIARGKLMLSRRIVDGREVLRHAVETCHAEAMEKQLSLAVTLPEQPLHVDADPARLQQVFWNLLKNAIKFTPDRGRITVTAAASEQGGLRVQVSDTGKGIEREALTRIFDAFEQGGSTVTKRYGGLGLGLAICKGLVGMHDGSIHAFSEGPGKGSTFVVELPPPAPRNERSAEQPDVQEHDRRRSVEGGCRILLVEDHESTAVMTARLLQSFGHQVTTADCVKCGLEAFEQQPFDLVISDLGLPDGSGQDLLRQLLAQRPVPAIALSGYGMESDIQQSNRAGFLEHLIKPINAKQLENAINRALGKAPPCVQDRSLCVDQPVAPM